MKFDEAKNGESKTQVTGQVRLQVRSQVRSGCRSGHRLDQVNKKNIFLASKLTNSKLTRYEKESVMMRGMVYFKLQDVALRD